MALKMTPLSILLRIIFHCRTFEIILVSSAAQEAGGKETKYVFIFLLFARAVCLSSFSRTIFHYCQNNF